MEDDADKLGETMPCPALGARGAMQGDQRPQSWGSAHRASLHVHRALRSQTRHVHTPPPLTN